MLLVYSFAFFHGFGLFSQAEIFEIKPLGLRLSPASQTILLGDDFQAEVVVDLRYDGELSPAATIKATLVGPGIQPQQLSFPAAGMKIRLAPGMFGEAGAYHLTNVRLEDGEAVIYASPRQAEILAAEDILVTRVEVRELGSEDLARLGYLFNENDYQTVEFSLSMVVGAVEIPVTVPVAYPRKKTSFFLPQVLRNPFGSAVNVKPMVSYGTPGLVENLFRQPYFEDYYQQPEYNLFSLLLMPGKFSYLKTHFSVTCVAMNTAPAGYDLKIDRLEAQLRLPSPTRIGFPLTLGSGEVPIKPVIHPGEDGQPGTGDDRRQIGPGEEASVAYVITGQVEGIYDVRVEVTGQVDLPSGRVKVTSVGTGRVLVRSPEFTLTLEHPDTVAEAEAYDVFLHFTNQGAVPLQGLSVSLDPNLLVGTGLDGSQPTQTLPDIAPGGEGTIQYHMRATTAGRVVASYFKVNGDVVGRLQLRMGIGESGERLTPYVITFPPDFTSAFPAYLTGNLKRYARKLTDFNQMTASELPAGIGSIESAARTGLLNDMALAARAVTYGVSNAEALGQLFSAWMRSHREADHIDALRRHLAGDTSLNWNLEDDFGQALADRFAGVSDADLLLALARENEDTPGLVLALVDAPADVAIKLTDNLSRVTDSTGKRNIPFGALIPLEATRTLIWLSDLQALPRLELTATGGGTVAANISLIFPTNNSGQKVAATFDLSLAPAAALSLDAELQRVAIATTAGEPYYLHAAPIAGKPFTMVAVRQADPHLEPAADRYGREIVFSFSKPIDLSSLHPLRDHLFINDKPAVDALLQSDGRFLFVSARMPLGPYKPIRWRLEGARALDGTLLPDQSGEAQAASWYEGVSVHGRVVDHQKSDLAGARIFLWQFDVEGQAAGGGRLNEITQMIDNLNEILNSDAPFPLRILAETSLDEQGAYAFDFVVFPPFATAASPLRERLLRSFRIGVALPDGRYEEREFWPQGAGQDIIADFAFNHLGSVTGQVRTAEGEAVPFAPIFVVNQQHADSSAITQTDADGYYRVDDLEVGQVLVRSRSGNFMGLGSGYLTAANSPLTVDVFIDTPTAAIAGSILFTDGDETWPVPDAFVGVLVNGSFDPLANELSYGIGYTLGARTGPDGSYILQDFPAGLSEFRIFHPQFGYAAYPVTLVEGETLALDHTFTQADFEGGSVSGTVTDINGYTLSGVVVYTHNQAVTTGPGGTFQLSDLPLNLNLTLNAFDGPGNRRGSATAFLDETHTAVTNLQIVVHGDILITGQVVDADGRPVPYVQIFKPVVDPTGFVAVTDGNGYWSATIPQNTGGTVHGFSVVDPPRIAYVEQLITEGGNNHVILQEKAQRDLVVHLRDQQGQPVVGAVHLEADIPSTTTFTLGVPRRYEGQQITDLDGTATFTNINAGLIKVWGSSQLLGETAVYQETLDAGEGPLDLVLTFIAPELSNLFGYITATDGVSPAPDGTRVQATVGGVPADIAVDAEGLYYFTSLVATAEPKTVRLVAYHPDTMDYAVSWLQLHQDLRFRHDLVLRSRGRVNVAVVHADGTPAEVAAVRLTYEEMTLVPGDPEDGGDQILIGLQTLSAQIIGGDPVHFDGIPTGVFSVKVLTGNGLAGAREYAFPATGEDVTLTVRLEAASRIEGIFIDDQELPIADAEVQLREGGRLLHQQLTGNTPPDEGRFLFDELPMRTYALKGTDPSTNREAHAEVETSPFQPVAEVTLRLDPIGDLEGIAYADGQPVAGAVVKLHRGNFVLITGTDGAGHYRFTNLRLGDYRLEASKAALPSVARGSVTLAVAGATVNRQLDFERTLDLDLAVMTPELLPASRILVTLNSPAYAHSAFTDAAGTAHFKHLPMGRYQVSGRDPITLALLDERIILSEVDPDVSARTVTFNGWGSVSGRITDSQGLALELPASVRFYWYEEGRGMLRTSTTDGDGHYRIGRVPLGQDIRFSAHNPTTLEATNGTTRLDEHGQEAELNLTFRGKTYVTGIVTYADGSPAPFARVWIDDPLPRQVHADGNGNFTLLPVLEGTAKLYAEDAGSPRRSATPLAIAPDAFGDLQPVTGLAVTLSGIGDLSGVVSLSNGLPVTSGTVTLSGVDSGFERVTTILGDGSYRFVHVPLGAYTLTPYDNRYAREKDQPDSLVLSGDGTAVVHDIQYEPSFTLAGELLAADGSGRVSDGLVQLWLPDERFRYSLVYSTTTNDQGFFEIENVYPANYRLKASDPLLENLHESNFTMPGYDVSGHPVQLQPTAWILGVVQDGLSQPYPGGTVILVHDGVTRTAVVAPDGSYHFNDLRPLPYTLETDVAGGWVRLQQSGTLAAGANVINLISEETVSVSGQAVLQQVSQFGLRAWLIDDNIKRELQLDASGQFTIGQVPVDQPLVLRLYYAGKKKNYPVGPFAADTDIGTFFLDATGPDLAFPDDGATFSSLPLALDFTIDDTDIDSQINTGATSVWLNGTDISDQFTTSADGVSGQFDLFPVATLRGQNQIVVRVVNDSNAATKKTFHFTVDTAGTMLVVDLKHAGAAQPGEVRLDGGVWSATDGAGRYLFQGIPAGPVDLKGKAPLLGGRKPIQVADVLTQYETLSIGQYGDYQGIVLGLDGQPVAGVALSIGEHRETSDAAGNFNFDLLPLGDHQIAAVMGDLLAFEDLPNLDVNQRVFIGRKIELVGSGTVSGHAFNGAGPMAGAPVTLQYKSASSSWYYPWPSLNTTTDSQGFYQFEDVRTYPISVFAVDPVSDRAFSVGEVGPEDGDTLTLDIDADNTGNLFGILVDPQGNPAANLSIRAWKVHTSTSWYATTDETGSFRFENVPLSTYFSLEVFDFENNAYYTLRLPDYTSIFSGDTDMGVLHMVANTAPAVLELFVPDPWDPTIQFHTLVRAKDATGLTSMTLTFSGQAQAEYTASMGGATYSVVRHNFDFPTNTPEGPIDYHLTVTDKMGATAVVEGTLQVANDVAGPEIAITSPAQGAIFNEGQAFTIKATASDIHGVDRVELYVDGLLQATDDSSPYQFPVYAPALEAPATVEFELRAYDDLNHVNFAELQVQVVPIVSSQGPDIALISPLEGMPQPISLTGGLLLPVAATVADPDGLDRVEVRFNDHFVSSTVFHGSQALFDETPLVPESLRNEPQLEVRLRAFDLGGNYSDAVVTVIDIAGQVIDQNTTLAGYDTSFDGTTLIVAGAVLTLNGVHQFADLVLVNGALLTQTKTDEYENVVAYTDIQVSGLVMVGRHSRIGMERKGYSRLPSVLGTNINSAHGGMGAQSSNHSYIYGSPFQPKTCGSFRGGGAVRVAAAGDIWLEGRITALPLDEITWEETDGSGGSIWLETANLYGNGQVNANGYGGDDGYLEQGGYKWEGSGGRIAVYGNTDNFAGSVTAYGGWNAGAGTIYYRHADASEPDGYRDRLVIANHPDSEQSRITVVDTLHDVEIGVDATLESRIIDNNSHDVLVFINPAILPYERYTGLRVVNGDYAAGVPVWDQAAVELFSPPNVPFPAMSPGDHIQITYQVDELQVGGNGRLFIKETPTSPLVLQGGVLVSGTATVDLATADLTLAGNVALEGSFLLPEITTHPDYSLALTGNFQMPALHHDSGTLSLDGSLGAAEVTIAAGAVLKTPDRYDAAIDIQTGQLVVNGDITAKMNGAENVSGKRNSHGGQGDSSYATNQTHGSLYYPRNQGVGYLPLEYPTEPAGGAVRLGFTSCILNGMIDVAAPISGSGGSILLEGGALSGSGSLDADAAQNPGTNRVGGGGRIAVLVDDIDGFTGTASALGSYNPPPGATGGAGTVLYRTATWPNGRLVLDNGGKEPPDRSTPLPGLGQRTATVATGNGPTISGSGFPDSLAGLYLVVDGYDPVMIAANTATELQAAAGETFPPLNPGDSYSGLHRLDRLELYGKAKLYSIDPLLLSENPLFIDGSLEGEYTTAADPGVLADGSTEWYADPGVTHLHLDNFDLVVHFPMNIGAIELVNGARLTYHAPVHATDITVESGSFLVAGVDSKDPGLYAHDVTLDGTSRWTSADTMSNGRAYPLVAEVTGTVTVESGGRLYTTGSSRMPTVNVAWGGGTYGDRGHGGYGQVIYDGFKSKIMGSFAKPDLPGTKQGGGAIHLTAAAIVIEGKIDADGYQLGSGGSIWLDAPAISGTGTVSVLGGKIGFQGTRYGAGRIAIYYGSDRSFMDTLNFVQARKMDNFAEDFLAGAPSIYLKSQNQAYGELIVDQDAGIEGSDAKEVQRRFMLTGITGPAMTTLGLDDNDPDPTIIQDLSTTALPPGLAGLYASFQVGGTAYFVEITGNTHNSLVLAEPVAAIVPQGTVIDYVLKLDKLTLHRGGLLNFNGIIDVGELVLDSPDHLTSITCRSIVGLPNPLVLNDLDFRLNLADPTALADYDLHLDQAWFYSDLPIQFRDITMVNGSYIRHSLYRNHYSSLNPALHLTAHSLTADSGSGINVRSRYGDTTAGYNHASISTPTYGTFGNLFQPTEGGNGPKYAGGRAYVRLDTLNGGLHRADGTSSAAGGSLWMDVDVLNGIIDLSAWATTAVGGGGRIALYYDNADNATLSFRAEGYYGPGTIYFQNVNEPYGHLLLDNGAKTKPNNLSPWGATPVPTIPVKTIGTPNVVVDSQAGTSTLTIPSLSISEDFVDYHLVVNGDRNRSYRVLTSYKSGSSAKFIVAGDLSDLASGDTVQLGLWLKSLTEVDEAYITPSHLLIFDPDPPEIDTFSVGGLVAGELVPGSAITVTVDAHDQTGLGATAVLFNGQTQTYSGSLPHTFNFSVPDPAPTGTMNVALSVSDRGGLVANSDMLLPVAGFDNTPPAVAIDAPADGSTVDMLADFQVTFSATDDTSLQALAATFNGETQNHTYDAGNQADPVSFVWTAPYVTADTVFPVSVTVSDGAGNTDTAQIGLLVHWRDVTDHVPQPVSYWSFDDADLDGDTVGDVMARNPGTNQGATTGLPGIAGESFHFATARVAVPPAPSLDFIGDGMTLFCWVRYDSGSPAGARIVSKAVDGNVAPFERYALEQSSATGAFRAAVSTDAGAAEALTPTEVADGNWHQLAGVYDGADLRLYLDGKQVSATVHAGNLVSAATPLAFGANGVEEDNYFLGDIDEVAVWDQALSTNMIRHLYQLGLSGTGLNFRPPEDVTAVRVTPDSDSLVLTWTPSVNSHSDLAGYRVDLDGTETVLPATATGITLTSLDPLTLYQVAISAFDDDGNQSPGVVIAAATLPLDPTDIPDPVSYWSMDDADINGSKVVDRLDLNHGTNLGATSGTAGVSGQALTFSQGKVTVANHASIDLDGSALTLFCWVRIAATGTNWAHVLSKAVETNASPFHRYGIEQINDLPAFQFLVSTDDGVLTGVSGDAVSLNEWHQLAGVYDGASLTLYIDGRYAGQVAKTGLLQTAETPFAIGANGVLDQDWFSGDIDEVAIWDQALSPEIINILYHRNLRGETLVEAPAPKKRVLVVSPLAASSKPSPDTLFVNESLTFTDLCLDGDLYLDGTQLTLAGSLEARSIFLTNGSTVSPAESGRQLQITVHNQFVVDASSALLLDGMGWQQPGPRANPSHGGLASTASIEALYDSPLFPSLPGGGRHGGGALVIRAREVVLDGTIRAAGLGFSSGGSVFISAYRIAGTGLIDAAGGDGVEGRGGGGRVALHGTCDEFNGRITTGSLLETSGSVVLADPNASYLVVGRRWPPGNQDSALLLPAATLEAVAIERMQRSAGSTLLHVSSPLDLVAYDGLWLRTAGSVMRITAIENRGQDRYRIELRGDLAWDSGAPLEFVVLARTIPGSPASNGAIPVLTPETP